MNYFIERQLTPDIKLIIPLDNKNLNSLSNDDELIKAEHVIFETKIKSSEYTTIQKAKYDNKANATISALITTVTNLMSAFDPSAQYWFKRDTDEPLQQAHKQIFQHATDMCDAQLKWQTESMNIIKFYLAIRAYQDLVIMSSVNATLHDQLLKLTKQDKISYNYTHALSQCTYSDMIKLWLDQLNKQKVKPLRDFLNL